MTTLDSLELNQPKTIAKLLDSGLTPKLMDMGMYPGKNVEIVFKAPFGGPIAVDLDGYTLSLRKEEALLVEVQ